MTLCRKTFLIAFILGLVSSTAAPVRAAMITSTFDSNAEGWTSVTLNYPIPGAPPPVLASYTPNWFAPGGTPGGFIYLTDPDGHLADGDTQYWRAPTAYHGNLSAYYGGTLSFDMTDYTASNFGPFNQEDIILVGGGLTLVYDTIGNPSTGVTWTHYDVGLSSSGWKLNSLSGAAATSADLQLALSSVTELYLRGEYQLGPDTANLDSVVLQSSAAAVPEPASFALFGLSSLGGLGLRWRLRRKVHAGAGCH